MLRALADFGAPSVAKEEDILTGKVIQIGVEPVRIDIISDLSGVEAAEIWDGREEGDVGGRRVAFIGRKTSGPGTHCKHLAHLCVCVGICRDRASSFARGKAQGYLVMGARLKMTRPLSGR